MFQGAHRAGKSPASLQIFEISHWKSAHTGWGTAVHRQLRSTTHPWHPPCRAYCSTIGLGALGYPKRPEQKTNQWWNDHHRTSSSESLSQPDLALPTAQAPSLIQAAEVPVCLPYNHTPWLRIQRCGRIAPSVTGGIWSLPLTFPYSACESQRQRPPASAGFRVSQENAY